ncbi:hypothetical protein ACSBPU_15530 [Parapusillimonas sp. JC17]|uniref:hypothetical protein n=1 Tax=Parapusillimonas sp. JC17 TaxID=3445768 RepID=UPI003FA0B1A4
MKTQIQFKKMDGSEGVALIDGPVSSVLQAKRELAAKLDLPRVDAADGEHEDVDAQLYRGDIEPDSIIFDQLGE